MQFNPQMAKQTNWTEKPEANVKKNILKNQQLLARSNDNEEHTQEKNNLKKE